MSILRRLAGLWIYLALLAAVWASGRGAAGLLLVTAVDVAVYLMVALTVNLEAGVGGIPNFGRTLTVALGAFLAGGVMGRVALWMKGIPMDYVEGNPQATAALAQTMTPADALALLLLTLAAAAALGAAVGVLTSLPARRLSQDYLAITLLAFGDVALYVGLNYEPLVGGTFGVMAPPIYERLFGGGTARAVGAALVAAALAAATYAAMARIERSPFGRALKVHREDPELLSALGRDPAAVRAWATAVGGAVSAVAGAVYALYVGAVHPRQFERITFTFYPWLMMVIGGMGNRLGVANGVMAFVSLNRAIDVYKYEIGTAVGFDPVWLSYILFGLLAMAIIALAPGGLVPEEVKPLMAPVHGAQKRRG